MLFDEETITQIYETKSSFTIYSVVRPLSIGKGYTDEIRPRYAKDFGVDILVGDPRLALMEDLLARDWGTAIAGEIRGLRTTFLFAHLLSLCSNYDYVFFDMGPSLGSINRSVLLASSFFVSPMSIDIFSLRAIENITLSLTEWRRLFTLGIERSQDPDDITAFHQQWRLRFAGYVMQQYIAKTKSGERRAVHAYERIMRRIPSVIKTEYIEKFQPGMPNISYNLGTVPNLYSLIPMSQTSHKPIFALRARDGVRGAHFTKVKDSLEIFRNIADSLEHNIELLSLLE